MKNLILFVILMFPFLARAQSQGVSMRSTNGTGFGETTIAGELNQTNSAYTNKFSGKVNQGTSHATGSQAAAFGLDTKAGASASFATGFRGNILASSTAGFVSGISNLVSGRAAAAFGESTISSGGGSISGGSNVWANANRSFGFGRDIDIQSGSDDSYVFGADATLVGNSIYGASNVFLVNLEQGTPISAQPSDYKKFIVNAPRGSFFDGGLFSGGSPVVTLANQNDLGTTNLTLVWTNGTGDGIMMQRLGPSLLWQTYPNPLFVPLMDVAPSGVFVFTNVVFKESITGNGSGLTNLNAAGIDPSTSPITLGFPGINNAIEIYSSGINLYNDSGVMVTKWDWDNGFFGNFTGNGGGLTNVDGLSGGVTNWIEGLVGGVNQHFYFSSVTQSFGITVSTNCSTMIDSPVASSATNSVAIPTAGVYFLSRVSTNTVTRIEAGPVTLETYVYVTGGGGVQTVTAHPELWLWFPGDTMQQIATSPPQLISEGSFPNLLTAIMNVNNNTNVPTGTRVLLRWFADAVANSPTWNFVIGGNYDSHISLNVAHQSGTYIGSFVGNGAGVTNIPGTNILYFTNLAHTLTLDMSKHYQAISTNNNIAWTGLSGVTSGGLNVDWAAIVITNTTAAAKTITTPAGWIDTATGVAGSQTYYITNQAWLSVAVYPGFGTNFTYRGGTK